MGRPPIVTGAHETFSSQVATLHRIARQVEASQRPAAWRAKVCQALNEAARMFNDDAERVLTSQARKKA